MCKDGLHGWNNWNLYVQDLWNKYCSVNTEEDNFFPVKFYDYDTEKWFGKDDEGSNLLVFDTIDKIGELNLEVTPDEDEVCRMYKEIDRPY